MIFAENLPVGADAAMRYLMAVFSEAGLDTPALDARLLTLAAAQISHEAMIRDPEFELSPSQRRILESHARRRLDCEPVSRILGRREFRGLDFVITPHVLDPRADSEVLVEAGLGCMNADARCRILDLGTGSGCLLVSFLAALPRAHGVGVDLSPDALACARDNAARNGVGERARFACGNWYDALHETFDLVVANPPYINHGELSVLPRDVVGYDPLLALDGGADGLDAYRAILGDISRVLGKGGWLVMEIGLGQETALAAMMRGAGLGQIRTSRDLAGHIRVLKGKLPKN